MAGVLHSCSMKEEEVLLSEDTFDMTTENVTQMSETEAVLYVYITGCVQNSGVYQMPKDARVYQVIEAAGGFTEEADQSLVNLASLVTDGEKIIVYSKEEASQQGLTPSDSDEKDALVNLNTATKEQLMELPGIGESKAESILTYRQEQGGFQKIEDIMNISGIKQAAFDKIKQLITV